MSDDTSRYRCLANLCPMFGGIFLAGPQAPGICSYHFGVVGHDMVRVTQALLDWECVTFEINRWRCALLHVDVDKAALSKAWTRMQPAVTGGWESELAPAPGESYVGWGARLERFMEARIKEILQRTPA